MTGMWLKAFLG